MLIVFFSKKKETSCLVLEISEKPKVPVYWLKVRPHKMCPDIEPICDLHDFKTCNAH